MGLLGGKQKQAAAEDLPENDSDGSIEISKGNDKKPSKRWGLDEADQRSEEEENTSSDGPAESDESTEKEDKLGKAPKQPRWFGRHTIDKEEKDGDSRADEGTDARNESLGTSGFDDESKKGPQINCEVVPDNENEFHAAIQSRNWDELEMLLKDYDFKKFVKPKPKPKKKNTKVLRVAKYIPEIPEMPWRKENIVPISPLCGLDALGRAPLHLCCVNPVPTTLFLKLLFVARDVASVPDETGSLPIHLAVQQERSVEVLDKLVRGYYQGSWHSDGNGRTPLMWAVEVARRLQTEENKPPTSNFWGFPVIQKEAEWQQTQEKMWGTVRFLLENRSSRRKKLLPREYRQIIQALGLAAPPTVISLFLTTGVEAFKKENLAGPALSLCISRQYPLDLLEKLIDECPVGFPKLYTSADGRGLVAAHYKIGCAAHNDLGHRRESFRMTMQHWANAKHHLLEEFEPPAPFLDWWGKLVFLINLWSTHSTEDSDVDFANEELLLHNALSNPDIPPSLIQLLAALYPTSTDIEHPKSHALPIHMASRIWRYRHYPPRRGEKEMKMDKVVIQLLDGPDSRTRKRYRDRLPLHHAIAAGKNWLFIKPLVVQDRKSLSVRDPTTKLYSFQLAAGRSEVKFDMETLTRHQYTPSEWNNMRDYEQDHQVRRVQQYYDLEQLTVIYELLRHSPDTINHETLRREAAARRAAGPQRRITVNGFEASDEVVTSTQMKMARALFGLGNVSGHFIAWAYESTTRGWKTHRTNFAVVKEAIMDGFVPSRMDKWWRKLKFWIWQDCPWDNIPRRDDFLLHGALCNDDTSPWIIELLLECFPRSASIPLPGSERCYPIHIACVTDKYVALPFEFANKRTAVEMTARAFPDATLLKWKNKLPLHLAISHWKQWDEIKFLAEDEPVALAVPDPVTEFFPFQLMALNRPYTAKQRRRFENIAKREVGTSEWKEISAQNKVGQLSKVLEQHETSILQCVWELLKLNPVLVSLSLADGSGDAQSDDMSDSSGGDEYYIDIKSEKDHVSDSDWVNSIESNLSLSVASLDFLEDVYEKDSSKPNWSQGPRLETASRRDRESLSDCSLSDPLLERATKEDEGPILLQSTSGSKRSVDYRTTVERHRRETAAPAREVMEYACEEVDPYFSDHCASIVQTSDGDGVAASSSNRDYEIDKPYLDAASDFMDKSVKSSRKDESHQDHVELNNPRRKDILLVTPHAAYVIWKNEVVPPGLVQKGSRKKHWLRILRSLGEQVDIGDLHTLRYKMEQTFISSVTIDGRLIFIDEDDTFIWILVGTAAASAVEDYDVETAMVVTSFLGDSETVSWLDPFEEKSNPDNQVFAKEEPHRALNWLLNSVENGPDNRTSKCIKHFMMTRSMLRKAFARVTESKGDPVATEPVIKQALRMLSFQVSKEKLNVRLKRFERIRIRYQIARAPRFERYRTWFYQSQKKVKFFKRLKKKQRHALRRKNTDSIKYKGARRHRSSHPKLDRLPPEDSPSERPVITAALEATEQAEELQARNYKPRPSKSNQRGKSSLDSTVDSMNLNQSKAVYEGENESLGSVDAFEPSRGHSPAKPLLASAIKARQQVDESETTVILLGPGREKASSVYHKVGSGAHLAKMNQPRMTTCEDDEGSLGLADIFDPPKGPQPTKPLLAAALKAKRQADESLVMKK